MNELKRNIISMCGDNGKEWLDSLPEITDKISQKHNLSGLTPINNMTFHYVASGYQNDKPIILKIGMNSKALTKEASCLKSFAGYGTVKVLAEDTSMLLLERALPGASLEGIYDEAIRECSGSPRDFIARDDEATKIVCSVIKKVASSKAIFSNDCSSRVT